MTGWLYHWIWLDFYVPVWPNIAASAAITVFLWWKLHAMHKLHKLHFELHKEHFEWHKDQGKEPGNGA